MRGRGECEIASPEADVPTAPRCIKARPGHDGCRRAEADVAALGAESDYADADLSRALSDAEARSRRTGLMIAIRTDGDAGEEREERHDETRLADRGRLERIHGRRRERSRTSGALAARILRAVATSVAGSWVDWIVIVPKSGGNWSIARYMAGSGCLERPTSRTSPTIPTICPPARGRPGAKLVPISTVCPMASPLGANNRAAAWLTTMTGAAPLRSAAVSGRPARSCMPITRK